MPAATRLGDSCSGHECFPPRSNTGGSPDVFVNGKPWHRQGDGWSVHTCTHPKKPHGSHGSSLAAGSSTVFVNGMQAGRVGDPVACGSSVASGSSNVFAGG